MKNNQKIVQLSLIIAIIIAVTFLIKLTSRSYSTGNSMLSSIRTQLGFGARNVGSMGRVKTQEYISNQLKSENIHIKEQVWQDGSGQYLKNIIGQINPDSSNRIIVATHYDTPANAERDKSNPNALMPGANDGASGVAMLLELGKSLSAGNLDKSLGVDLVFFDGEEFDPGEFNNWKPKGSTYFAKQVEELYADKKPSLAIDVDMVCDADLQIYKDPYSLENAPKAVHDIWSEGQKIDKNAFKENTKFEIKDDITPLIDSGIPGVLIIDYSYPYFHTSKDTIDNCSAKSLETVYGTIKNYLQNYTGN